MKPTAENIKKNSIPGKSVDTWVWRHTNCVSDKLITVDKLLIILSIELQICKHKTLNVYESKNVYLFFILLF